MSFGRWWYGGWAGQVVLEVTRGGLQYLVKRCFSVSPWGGGAAGRGRGDLAVGALLP